MFVIIGSMKNVLILKPEIIQKQNYNKSRETSLSMLCMANKDLKLFLYNKASTNPFLSFQTVSDEIINYRFCSDFIRYDSFSAFLFKCRVR